MEKELLSLRNELDTIDNEILDLLNKRMLVVKKVGNLKQKSGGAIYRPEREKAIINRLAKLSKNTKNILTKDAIEAIFLEIFAVSRNLELPEKIAFLGPLGTYTHQAAEIRFGAISEYIAISSINGVFKEVNSKRAKFGVVPIENSSGGIVIDTLVALNEYDLKIIANFSIPIHHSFASNCEKISDIKKIYSKDIVFSQCRNFLEEYNLNNIELIPVNSTAKAVKISKNEPYSAAICSHIAAKLYNLPILFDSIEDDSENKTNFIIISDFENEISGEDNSAILAKLSKKPGSLVSFLKEFKNKNINLTKIESHIIKQELIFYIEFNGHKNDDNVKQILDIFSDKIKFLGSYVR